MKKHSKKRFSCEGSIKPFKKEKIGIFLNKIKGWIPSENKLRRDFNFKDFKEAISFVNKVSEIAEKENHHPDIHIFYNVVKLEIFTHSINGLSEKDFILAGKVNKIIS